LNPIVEFVDKISYDTAQIIMTLGEGDLGGRQPDKSPVVGEPKSYEIGSSEIEINGRSPLRLVAYAGDITRLPFAVNGVVVPNGYPPQRFKKSEVESAVFTASGGDGAIDEARAYYADRKKDPGFRGAYPGEVVIADAGRLAERETGRVDHLLISAASFPSFAGDEWEMPDHHIPAIVSRALIKASKEGYESLAFPLIGHGVGKKPLDRVLGLSRRGVNTFASYAGMLESEIPPHVNLVYFVAYEPKVDDSVRQAMREILLKQPAP